MARCDPPRRAGGDEDAREVTSAGCYAHFADMNAPLGPLLLVAALALPAAAHAEPADAPATPAATAPIAAEPAPAPAAPAPSRLRLLPASLETGGILALEIVWYESAIELNKQDFDFARTWDGQAARWRHGIRFDDNGWGINMGHAYYNGSFYYDVSRVLGGSILESWLFTLATSSIWEATVEHREVFSVNDTIVTPAGGAAIGETFFQLGRFFERGSPTVANRVLTTLFSPAQTLNDLVGLTRPERTLDVDRLGFPRDVWHRFTLDLGGALSSRGQASGSLRLEPSLTIETDLVAVPGHGRPGELAATLRDGEWTRARFFFTRDDVAIRELSIYTQASLWGRYRQQLRAEGASLFGHGRFWGAATAFDFSIARLRSFDDFIGVMHVAGPVADATWYQGRLSVRGSLAGFLDFANPRAIAWDELKRRGAVLASTKSVLEREGYTHAWGFTGAAKLAASWRGLEASGELRYDWFDSIEGLDRHQLSYTSGAGVYYEGLADDFDVRDQRRTLRASLSWQLPDLPWSLRLFAEDWLRTGQAKGVEARFRAQRLGLSVGAVL